MLNVVVESIIAAMGAIPLLLGVIVFSIGVIYAIRKLLKRDGDVDGRRGYWLMLMLFGIALFAFVYQIVDIIKMFKK